MKLLLVSSLGLGDKFMVEGSSDVYKVAWITRLTSTVHASLHCRHTRNASQALQLPFREQVYKLTIVEVYKHRKHNGRVR